MAADGTARERRFLSLRARLLIICAVLSGVASLTVGIVAVNVLERSMYDQVDGMLDHAFERAADVVEGNGPTAAWGLERELDATTVLQGPAQSPGTLAVVLHDGSLTGGTIGNVGEVLPLSVDVLDRLVGLPLDEAKRTLSLGADSGNYRLIAGQVRGASIVIGLPLASTESIIAGITWTVVVSTMIALGGLVLLGRVLIRRGLRPLEHLAQTADLAAQRELAVGDDVGLDRIDLSDIDPRSEVGRVLTAYNRMVDNVEGALRDREESEQQVRRFVADASHELRTPLASIRGYSELVRRMGPEDLPVDVVHSIGRIEAESLRMQALVEDLLLLTRLDQGQELRLQSAELVTVLGNAVADAQIADTGRTWVLEHEPASDTDPVLVHADPHRLHQVFANLLANARSHTPPGTQVVVRAKVDRAAGWVSVEVSDNGPGIPAEILPRVFERFVRGDTQRVRKGEGGTGLGLPIVAAIVQAFGGETRASSGPEGATFTIDLRLVCLDGNDPLG